MPAGGTGCIPGCIPTYIHLGGDIGRGTQIGKIIFLEEHEDALRDTETRIREQIKSAWEERGGAHTWEWLFNAVLQLAVPRSQPYRWLRDWNQSSDRQSIVLYNCSSGQLQQKEFISSHSSIPLWMLQCCFLIFLLPDYRREGKRSIGGGEQAESRGLQHRSHVK